MSEPTFNPDEVLTLEMTVREFRSMVKALYFSSYVGTWPDDISAMKLRDLMLTRQTFNNGRIPT
jgi:hypothetical protein